MDFILREATPDDYEAIGDVDVEAFVNSDYGRATGLLQRLDEQERRHRDAVRYARSYKTIVAVSAQTIVGFVLITGHIIHNLAVLPNYRNRGIGTALAKAAVAEGATEVFTAHSQAALRMYEKAGFTKRTPRHHGHLLERGKEQNG